MIKSRVIQSPLQHVCNINQRRRNNQEKSNVLPFQNRFSFDFLDLAKDFQNFATSGNDDFDEIEEFNLLLQWWDRNTKYGFERKLKIMVGRWHCVFVVSFDLRWRPWRKRREGGWNRLETEGLGRSRVDRSWTHSTREPTFIVASCASCFTRPPCTLPTPLLAHCCQRQ